MRPLPLARSLALIALGCGILATSCSDDGATEPSASVPLSPITPRSVSVTPALVKNVASGVGVFSLLSSEDVLAASPRYTFGGSIDGMGLLREADGTFTLVANNEDNFSVSRIRFDRDLRPVHGDYLLNSDGGRWRLCSATLVTPEEHGFGPLFITAGESGQDPMIHAVDPHGALNSSKLLPALGRWMTENAVPLPKDAFPGKTVIVIGDDDSGVAGGQVALYVANAVGDLDNGSVYVVTKPAGVTRERDMAVGRTYAVTFARIDGARDMTSAQLNARAVELGAIAFGRTEDLDYRKGGGAAGREIYFNVTGQAKTGVNADFSRTYKGRVYKLVLDAADPTRGTLEVLLDADDTSGPAKVMQNPDNMVATRNYLYIEEDPNEYGDETHDAYLWQYNLQTKELKTILELDHRRGETKYGGASRLGSWESSGMIDVSDRVGLEGAFLFGVQAHTWRDARFRGVDGGSLRPNEDQGSQLLLLTGLPR